MFLTCFPENLVKNWKKHRVFSLCLQALSTKIAKNIEFLAFFEKMLAQNVQKHACFLQFLQINFGKRR